MATQNAILNKSSILTIDPLSSSDSFVQYDINSTGKFRIGVDDTDDSFRISQGSALGTNDTFVMTAAGERTMPLQPAFLAYNSAVDVNVTGDGTVATVEFDTEVYDQGSDYNNGTDTFTAPITGKYFFFCCIRYQGFDGTQTNLVNTATSSNGTFTWCLINPDPVKSGSNELRLNMAIEIDMDASDTVQIHSGIGSGNKVIDIYGAADRSTVFGGYLLT